MTYTLPHNRTEAEKDRLLFGSNVKKLTGAKKKPSKATLKESDIHTQVCKYIKAQYPKIIFLSDFGAGIKMTDGMARRQVAQKSNHSFPDLMIFEPRNGFHGLFIELKRDIDSLYNKNGLFKKSEHIENQINCLMELCELNYYAVFACGFDEAKKIIDNYLK